MPLRQAYSEQLLWQTLSPNHRDGRSQGPLSPPPPPFLLLSSRIAVFLGVINNPRGTDGKPSSAPLYGYPKGRY